MYISIWKPHWSYERVNEKLCRAAVHVTGRGVGFNQCQRKPAQFIDNLGFCKQHAVEYKDSLPQNESKFYTMYQVGNQFSSEIKEIQVIRHTSSFVWIVDTWNNKSNIRKSKRFDSYNNIFEIREEAILFLRKKLEGKISAAKREIEYCEEKLKELEI